MTNFEKATTNSDQETETVLALKHELQATIEAIRIPANWRRQLDENPYRLSKDMYVVKEAYEETPEILRNFYEARRKYALYLNNDNTEGQAHMQDELFKESQTVLLNIHEVQEASKNRINQIEEAIFESNLAPEQSCDALDTKRHLVDMNRYSAEVPEGCWSPDKLKSMNIKDYLAHVANYSSGRSFCHTFPMISFRKGEIVTGSGGDIRSDEGFENVRDGAGGLQINFTPEAVDQKTNSIRHRHYIGLKQGGNVYFPAEVLLDNFALLNLPYTDKDNWVSSEWRNVAPPNNLKSNLHAVPLELGVVFFSKEFEGEYNQMVTENPDLALPRVVFVDSNEMPDGDPLGLNKMLTEAGVNGQANSLPHIAGTIRPIGEINGTTVFGTRTVGEQWSNANN